MDGKLRRDSVVAGSATTTDRKSDRELVVTRRFAGRAHLVFEAWVRPELLMQWWAPKSFGITFISCEVDARTGGTYRFVFGHPSSETPMAFFGRYLEVAPHTRIVWTNDEGAEGGAVTTVTFEEHGNETVVMLHDLYPSKEALDDAISSGSTCGFGEAFGQLDQLLECGQA